MVQVSKRMLQKQVTERIMNLFWSSLASLSSEDVSLFLDDLLTPTEKIMLAKRFSIAFMLLKDYDYFTINNILKVSDPTIWSIKTSLTYKGKGYKRIISKIMKEEKWKEFWQNFDNFLVDLLPPPKNSNWKEVRRKQWEKRRLQQKPF